MGEMMNFPDTWEEFEKSYGFTDSKEVYTNGSRLIPSFRVKQWLDHIAQKETKQRAIKASDCINRQDAMELVRDVCDAIMSGCDSYYDTETGDEVYKDILEVDAILKCNKEIRIALKNMPSAPLYTPDEIQTMQDLEWAQMEKMYELGKAERKKGKWIPHEGGKFVGFPYMHYECSECRAFEPTETTFCPNCGADMRGDLS